VPIRHFRQQKDLFLRLRDKDGVDHVSSYEFANGRLIVQH
jgi:hypothetical protein